MEVTIMTLVRWDPFHDLLNLQQRWSQRVTESGDAHDSWAPLVDIFENGDDLVISAELPGVTQEDIDVQVEDNTLKLSGERKRETEHKDGESYRTERVYGKFVRSFRLPKTIDATRIAARFKNGVLEITLPKAEETKPKKIDVKAA
jgi:HSP20 family protein